MEVVLKYQKNSKKANPKKNSLYKDVDLWEIICENAFCAILCDKKTELYVLIKSRYSKD